MRFLNIKTVAGIHAHLIDYPSPVVGYISTFGSLSGICLVIQLLTGILLVAHYTPHITKAFLSIEHIIRDVNDGQIFRYYHSNGASLFFLCLYIHINNNDDESIASDIIQLSGGILYLLVIATAFIGYILPWGQISFQGATVITNLFAAIPYVGIDIAIQLQGGFSVDNPTLNRFFSFHYLVPFLICGVVLIHLQLLHSDGSSSNDEEYVEFYYYYFIKDLLCVLILILIFLKIVFLQPEYLSHYDNYNPADAKITPSHLVPEQYFLPLYGALRATPDKFGGLLLIFLCILDLFFLDIFIDDYEDLELSLIVDEDDKDEDGGTFLAIFFFGGRDIEEPYIDIGAILSFLQFIDYLDLDDN